MTSNSKDGGLQQLSTVSPEQLSALQQMIQMGSQNTQNAAAGYNQFLPGGGGGEAFKNQANQNFQQNTIPSILNAFGSGNKGGSSLNQALAVGGANMNTDLSALLQGNALNAAQGLGNLGTSQQNTGATTQTFGYKEKQPSIWSGVAKGGLTGAAAGAPLGVPGAAIGGGIGALLALLGGR